MNWQERLFKPKWQNKNTAIRLEAVSNEHDPRLIASLVDMLGDEREYVHTAAKVDGSGVVMAIRHRRFPVVGLQFHPESVLTDQGYRLLQSFLRLAGLEVPESLPELHNECLESVSGESTVR